MLHSMHEAVRPNHRPRQFRLIMLFVVMVLACVPLAWLASHARQSRARAATEQKINALGGRVESHFAWPTTVDLDHAQIQNDDLKLLAEFPSLEYLYLGGTPISDDGLAHVAELDELSWLDLRDTQVSDAGLEHLKGLSKLRMLRVNGSRITMEGLKKLKSSIPELDWEVWR